MFPVAVNACRWVYSAAAGHAEDRSKPQTSVQAHQGSEIAFAAACWESFRLRPMRRVRLQSASDADPEAIETLPHEVRTEFEAARNRMILRRWSLRRCIRRKLEVIVTHGRE